MKKMIMLIFLLNFLVFAQTAQEIINENGCFACHAIASKKTAPAFAGIARKNLRFEGSNAKATIMNSIKNGSKGKFRRFAGAEMPSFRDFDDEMLNTLADYILSLSSQAKGCSNPKMGMR